LKLTRREQYLDCGYGKWLNSEHPSDGYPFENCTPRKNWRAIYAYDPAEGVPEKDLKLVIGGEAHIWSEMIDSSSLDTTAWPRLSAAAEVLWSGGRDANGRLRSQIDAALRISEMRERLVAMGINAEAIQMPFCTMEKNQCNG
jgi:hexosaminidase